MCSRMPIHVPGNCPPFVNERPPFLVETYPTEGVPTTTTVTVPQSWLCCDRTCKLQHPHFTRAPWTIWPAGPWPFQRGDRGGGK